MSDPMRVAVFTIPSHRSFADALAAGLIARFGKDPLGLARGRILLPNNRAVRAVTEAFVTSSPRKTILPESGRKYAVTTLHSEVLPAPFGPTSDTNSPSSIVRLTLSTARVSPKYFLSSMVRSRLMAPSS